MTVSATNSMIRAQCAGQITIQSVIRSVTNLLPSLRRRLPSYNSVSALDDRLLQDIGVRSIKELGFDHRDHLHQLVRRF